VHIISIVIYSLPELHYETRTSRFKNALAPLVRPYLFVTSQWQQWNLFAPDPLRRIDHYVVQIESNGAWTTVEELTPETLPWWRMADELKLMGSFAQTEYSTMRVPYLKQYCRELSLPSGTSIRMMTRSAVISKERPSDAPQWSERMLSHTRCP
jgi:hypothetical protein